MPQYYPVVVQAGRSLMGDSLGFHAYSLRIDNLTNQWLLEESSLAWIPPYSLGTCLRLYGTSVGLIVNQAPPGQQQAAAVVGEQTVGVYSDQYRTEVGSTPVRQFSYVQAVSDITEGPQPIAPGIGICRLWADTNGNLFHLHSDGSDPELWDTRIPFGGVLTGTCPNPGLANGVVQTVNLANGAVTNAILAANSVATNNIQNGAVTAAKWSGTFDNRPYGINSSDILADRGNNSGYYMFPGGGRYLGWSLGTGFSWNTLGDDIYIGGSRITGMMNASLDYQHLINGTISSIAQQTSDGSSYTQTVTGTTFPVPGMSPASLSVNCRGGTVLVLGQIYCSHSAGSYLSGYCNLDGTYQWLTQELIASSQQTQIQFSAAFQLTVGTHTFQLGWSTSSPGTATRLAWLSRLTVLELSR